MLAVLPSSPSYPPAPSAPCQLSAWGGGGLPLCRGASQAGPVPGPTEKAQDTVLSHLLRRLHTSQGLYREPRRRWPAQEALTESSIPQGTGSEEEGWTVERNPGLEMKKSRFTA
ncbi:hypothetical protein VULLAG_LOCUS15536 [Vulpes lagopus]